MIPLYSSLKVIHGVEVWEGRRYGRGEAQGHTSFRSYERPNCPSGLAHMHHLDHQQDPECDS